MRNGADTEAPHYHGGMRRRIIKSVGIGLALSAMLVAGLSGGASAQQPTDIHTPVIQHYGEYPSATVSGAVAGCSMANVHGSLFTLSRDGAEVIIVDDLRLMPQLAFGDVVHWAWESLDDPCGTSWLSLGLKESNGDTFDPSVDQFLDGSQGIQAPGTGPNHFDIEMTALNKGCYLQLDALLGLPLADVGPSGSYYTPESRGDKGPNMLVSAWNGHYEENCQGPTITVPRPTPAVEDEGPPLTVGPPGEEVTTTITEAPTTTTTSTPTVDPVAFYLNCAAVEAAGVAPILAGQPGYRPALDGDGDGIGCEVESVVGDPVAGQTGLAVTGRPVGGWAVTGFAVVGSGLALLLLFPWKRRSSI